MPTEQRMSKEDGKIHGSTFEWQLYWPILVKTWAYELCFGLSHSLNGVIL
jgi:hypothetical protein